MPAPEPDRTRGPPPGLGPAKRFRRRSLAAALGPSIIRYHINAHTGVTVGDVANNMDNFFAEGCDKF